MPKPQSSLEKWDETEQHKHRSKGNEEDPPLVQSLAASPRVSLQCDEVRRRWDGEGGEGTWRGEIGRVNTFKEPKNTVSTPLEATEMLHGLTGLHGHISLLV